MAQTDTTAPAAPQEGFDLTPAEGLPGTIRETPSDLYVELRRFLVGAVETGGTYAAFEESVRPGDPGRAHIHHGGDEAFFVLEGEFSFLLGDRTIRATPGAFIFVPRGTVHGFRNEGERPARFLAIVSPGEFATYLQDVSVAVGTGGRFDTAEVAAVRQRYPQHLPIEWVERRW
jgi:quercetin dioxygenase-like cupin family protein